jgi:integrase
MNAAGVEKHFTIHDLRRTAATIMTAAGTPITVVAKALGHANVQTTPVYARASDDAVREAMEKSAIVLLGGT